MNKNENKPEKMKLSVNSMVVLIVIVLMIGAIIFAGTPMLGLQDFTKDLQKEKIKNEDGTYSILQDAPVQQNADNKDTYIGRVMNEKIQFSRDDYFNRQLSYIMNVKSDPYSKYFYAKQVFNSAINRIIGIKIAEDKNYVVSKNYLTDTIGKQYYSDASGDIDKIAMKKDTIRVNQLANQLRSELLYDNFSFDYFDGLPVSSDEMLDKYKMENVKITIKYVNVVNNNIDDKSLKSFYEQNLNNYKMYKLSKMIFKDKKDADKTLVDLKKDPKIFNETGRKLKVDQKIVNIINETEFAFISDLENESYKTVVKNTTAGNVGASVIVAAQGPVIVKVEEITDGDFSTEKVKSKVKNDYMIKNMKEINDATKKVADEIYNESKTSGLDKIASKYNLKVEKSSPVEFLGSGLPNLNADATEDRNYTVNLFKGKKGDVMAPFKYQDGYMIASIEDKTEVSMSSFESLHDDLLKKYVNNKAREIEEDFYTKERKKHEIINNFDYVITPQFFSPKEDK
jgi:parvulin-like peptidyl-prolyl isomerase